jgi:hypothetical protein
VDNKLHRQTFLDDKTNLSKTTFKDLRDIILLCITLWTLLRRSTVSGTRKPKVSNANGIKICWLSEYVFSCFVTLFEAAFRTACPTVKSSVSNQIHISMFASYPSMHQNIHSLSLCSHYCNGGNIFNNCLNISRYIKMYYIFIN